MATPSGILVMAEVERRKKEKLPKILAYLSCSDAYTHFARTNTLLCNICSPSPEELTTIGFLLESGKQP
jgi:hypothetical protein